tara:strand:- start:210 stop:521 length:312 start_codon:yes stop_codon:yes gene_type:complete
LNIIKHENWKEINSKIKKFATENEKIENISLDNEEIYFESFKTKKSLTSVYFIDFKSNSLILKDKKSNRKLLIPFDKNCLFSNVLIKKNFLEIELSSKVIINS